MNIRFLIIALLTITVLGCKKDDFKTYEDDVRYLYFEKDSSQLFRFSFVSVPDEDVYEFPIPLKIVGSSPSSDVAYKISLNSNLTTLASDGYTLPTLPIFHAGKYQDTLFVKLNRTTAMKTNEYLLALSIESNDNFISGPVKYNMVKIMVSDIIARPDWWTDAFSIAFLGDYSNEKYTEFIRATAATDLTDKSISEIEALCREFVYYLRRLKDQGQEVLENDGTPMLETININA